MSANIQPPIHCKIGSTVKIDLFQIRDRIPINLKEDLVKSPIGQVVGYKMTDGQGIGVIVKLKNGSVNWFFVEEINSFTEHPLGNRKEDVSIEQTKFKSK